MRAKPASVDEYLAALPDDAGAALRQLRETIRAAAPAAEETISYQIPTFKYLGPLVAFAAFKDHCSFFPMSPTVLEAHREELKAYKTAKGTIRFAPGEGLPAALVTKLVKARIDENEAAAEQKTTAYASPDPTSRTRTRS